MAQMCEAIKQSGPEKIPQSLMHRHFAMVYSRIMRFAPKWSEKITAYQSMQNLNIWLNILW